MAVFREWLALGAFILSAVFTVGGCLGLFRFPDPYSRLQAGSLAGTTAVISALLGALFIAPNWAIAGRILIILVFFLLSSPTGGHIVARFTWNSNISPWRPKDSRRSGVERRSRRRRKKEGEG